MKIDAENRDPQETRHTDERSTEPCFLPSDVSRAIHRAEPAGTPSFNKTISRADTSKIQRQSIGVSGLLPHIAFPERSDIDLQGTEHVVRFCGQHVEKHQKADAWHPIITKDGKLSIGHALPSEYLRRLDLQNSMFGDRIRIIALTRGMRFVTTQPTLQGGEPTEIEIRDVLELAGWKRVPMEIQDLPTQLMGSAWWHEQEDLILIDARKPNFKKTSFGVLPIDLILADITEEMREILR